ncbi:MAG: CotH kinase family protein [Lachnospiraceae bacterium]|nr:CotH kinase family protein [Lachnospiraceae bacterium]
MRLKKIVLGVMVAGLLGLCAGCGEEANGDGGKATPVPQVTAEATPEVTPEANKDVTPASEVQVTEAAKVTPAPTEPPKEEETTTVATPVYGEVPLILIETENNAGATGDEIYTNCTVTVTNCEVEYELAEMSAGIRWRGNSTQMYEKKPYRIKFTEKQQLLGLSEGAHKSWVLLAEMNDPTLLRNFLTYRLANELDGISYATDCELVEVYLDGEYIGMYLLAEQTQVDGDRIALDESGVTDGSIVDTGYLLELEADSSRRNEEGAEGEAWFRVTGYASENDNSMQMLMERSFDETAAYYVVKSDARSAEQMAYIQDFMIQVYDAVYKEQTKEAVETLVDLDSAVDMYLVQLIGNDFDNNYSSMFVYKDAGGKLEFGAPWDFDLAYGNFNGYTEAEDTIYMYHLLRKLGEYDWFKELVTERYKEIATGENSLVLQMKTLVETVTKEYAGAFGREYTRWRENLVGMGGFGDWGNWGDWEMPEGGDFGNWGEWNPEDWEMPEGEWNPENWQMPEGDWSWGEWNPGDWQMPEDGEGFGAWSDWGNWQIPEDAENWGNWGNMGDFGGMNNFSYGAVYDTHEAAVKAFLSWLDARLLWVEEYLGMN